MLGIPAFVFVVYLLWCAGWCWDLIVDAIATGAAVGEALERW